MVILGVLEYLSACDLLQELPQGSGVFNLKFPFGGTPEKRAKYRLHDILGIFSPSRSLVHFAFDQRAQPSPEAAVQLAGGRFAASKYAFVKGLLGIQVGHSITPVPAALRKRLNRLRIANGDRSGSDLCVGRFRPRLNEESR